MSLPRLSLALLIGATVGPAFAQERVFAPAEIVDWATHSFDGMTSYRYVELDGQAAVRAVADDTASALYREVRVDLTETPYLEWRWRIDTLPHTQADERASAGDDFAARLYVVKEGTLGQLTARTINYVWSRTQPVGAAWPGPVTERSVRHVVASGTERLGEWVSHRRNVRADWREIFRESIDTIDGIAIVTDTDDTDARAQAHYGTIRFTDGR